MLGGFTWLSAEVRRIEAKVDTVSLGLSEMPGTLQGAVQAQTESLSGLISAQRQSGIASRPGGAAASTRGVAPAPAHARTTDASHISSNPRGVAAAGSTGVSVRGGGTATNATTTKLASGGAISGTPRRP